MPQLSEIQGKLNVDGLICSLTINQAIEEIQQYREQDDVEGELAIAVLENMLFALVDALEPIEE